MTDKITQALQETRVARVQVRLSEKEVVSGIPASGFWPRVTLERPGKSKTVPLTGWGETKKQELKKGELSDIEKAILNFAGGTVNTPLARSGRRHALNEATFKVREAINRAIRKAALKGPAAERHTAAERRYRKQQFLTKFREFCEINGKGLEYEDIRPSELGRVWDEVRRLKVAGFVMDS